MLNWVQSHICYLSTQEQWPLQCHKQISCCPFISGRRHRSAHTNWPKSPVSKHLICNTARRGVPKCAVLATALCQPGTNTGEPHHAAMAGTWRFPALRLLSPARWHSCYPAAKWQVKWQPLLLHTNCLSKKPSLSPRYAEKLTYLVSRRALNLELKAQV